MTYNDIDELFFFDQLTEMVKDNMYMRDDFDKEDDDLYDLEFDKERDRLIDLFYDEQGKGSFCKRSTVMHYE